MKRLLKEGPVGHMWHPFDLDTVQNGKDLLSVFQNEVVEYINNFTPSIKIDGINGPIRLITNEREEREFAIDRLSTSPLDRRGVTADRLKERFEKAILVLIETGDEIKLPLHKLASFVNLEDIAVGVTLNIVHKKKKYTARIKEITTGHGFVNDGSVALAVVNAALRTYPSEMQGALEALGMWDNDDICLNNDIVHESSKESGMVNAVIYGEDFIAFHGLNEIFVPEGKKARKTKEIKMDNRQKKALVEFVRLCNESNPIEGFRVLSPFDTVALKGEMAIDYSDALNVVVTIHMDKENAISKSIGNWLMDSKIVKPSYDEKYTFSDGRTRSYFSKANYVALIPDKGEKYFSIRDLLSEEAHPEISDGDYYKFASAAIFYHATRLLGREVLEALVNKSKVGNEALTSHEGVVMRSKEIFGVDTPIKITGDFIRSGMMGGISQKINEISDVPPSEIGDEDEEQVEVTTEGSKIIAIMPGSFKPPHAGHLKMAETLAKKADEVLIFVSAPQGSKRLLPFSGVEITYDKANELWDLLLKNSNPNIRLVRSDHPSPSPITALGDLMKPKEEREYYSDVELYAEDYSLFLLGMSEKEKDDPASMARFSMYDDDPKVKIAFVPAFQHSAEYADEITKLVNSSGDALMALEQDIEMKGAELAQGLVSSRAAKNLPANPTIEDYIAALSKANKMKVAKFMKSTPKHLDKKSYSATDLRVLLDLAAVYKLPVHALLADFIGLNVADYLKIIFGEADVNESINVIQKMIRLILKEELLEVSTLASGAVEVGGARASAEDEEEEEEGITESGCGEDPMGIPEQPKYHPSELPQQPGLSKMIITLIPHSRSKATGVASDAVFKKAVKNRFNMGGRNIERRPAYAPGDVITDLVERILISITS